MITEDKPKVYDIPENFIDESRIVNGMFETRKFIEGVIMALIVLPIGLAIPASDFNTKIMIVTSVCGPLFLLGNAGFNGDPISTTLVNAYKWFKYRGIMLYDFNARSLIKSPLAARMEKEQPRDKLVDMIDNIKEKQREKASNVVYVEGETFEFTKDKALEDIRADNYVLVEGYEDESGNFVELSQREAAPKKQKAATKELELFVPPLMIVDQNSATEEEENKEQKEDIPAQNEEAYELSSDELDLDSIFGKEN